MRLRVLTLNMWALPVPLPREERAARMARLREMLPHIGADVIMLQEALHPRDRDGVIHGLAAHGYAATPTATRRVGGLMPMDANGGLVTLSRLPLESSSYHRLPVPPVAKWTERHSGKGVLRCVVRTSEGPLACLNVHLYAGTSPEDRAARLAQLAAAPLVEAPGMLATVLAGDINATVPTREDGRLAPGPEMAALMARGFHDVVGDDADGARHATYAVRSNRYAAMWADSARGDERLDVIMVRPAAGARIARHETRVVFDTADTLVSDHYGVRADLAITAAESPSR